MKTLLIAGGKGRRLADLAPDIPKPLFRIAGIPIIERQLNLLKGQGLTDIYIMTGHLGDVIEDYLGDGKGFGVELRYVRESSPLGTAGCLYPLRDILNEPFLVVYADLVADIDLNRLISYHIERKADVTLVVHPNDHPYDSDIVEMDNDNRIKAFHLKADKPEYYPNLVSAAIYVLNPITLDYIHEGVQADFVKDIFTIMLREDRKIFGFRTSEYVKDVGTPDRIEKVARDLADGRVSRKKRAAIFLDRDGTIVEYIKLLHRLKDLALFPFTPDAIKTINASDYLALVVTNQPVVARGLCSIETVEKIHHKLETLLGDDRAYLDGIYFCPHHPDSGYTGEDPRYKIRCNCRKPATGMIRRAVEEYGIEIADSWLVGDSSVDIQTGINCGLKTALVHTGLGGKDGRYPAVPDYTFDHIYDAARFICNSNAMFNPLTEIIERGITGAARPYVITIGGHSRSGKSTIARYLSHYLDCPVLSLDNYLLPKGDRSDWMTVLDRYRYYDIERDIQLLTIGREIAVDKYDPYSREIIGSTGFSINGARCVILDGVVGLNVSGIVDRSDLRIFVSIDETERKRRFFWFYRWKEMPESEIEWLYEKRMSDEYPIIEGSRRDADIIIEDYKVIYR